MVRRIALIVLAILVLLLAYLLFWPVPVRPVAWQSPPDRGYTGSFIANDALALAKSLPLEGERGPAAAAAAPEGGMFIATRGGHILHLNAASAQFSRFADTQGLPLGLAIADGRLVIADARRGLLAADAQGGISVLASGDAEGSPLHFPTAVAAASDGTIYLADATSTPGIETRALRAGFLAMLQHGGDGRVLRYDPSSGKLTTVVDGLNFPAGLALTRDGRNLLVVEAGSYRVLRLPLSGESKGEAQLLLDNLPGLPAHIDRADDGTFWLGIAAPRSFILDRLSDRPFLRKVLARLPRALRPHAARYGFLVHFDEDGNVLETLQDPSGRIAYATGAVEGPENLLFVTSLVGGEISVLPR